MKIFAGRVATAFLCVSLSGPVMANTTASTPAGVWKGQYVCGQVTTGLTLSIKTSGNQLQANFSFYPLSDTSMPSSRASTALESGEFSMLGTYDQIIGEVALRPDKWIQQPSGYRMGNLKGLMSEDGNVMSGSVELVGCQRFHLERTSMTDDNAREVRAANKPSPQDVRPLSSVRSTAAKCDVLLAWLSRLEFEYPAMDMDRTAARQTLRYSANLFRDEYFLKVFGKSYSRISSGSRKRLMSGRMIDNCQRTWINSGRRNAHAYIYLLEFSFRAPSPQFESMVENTVTAKSWMDRILSAAGSYPGDVESIELIDSYLAKGGVELAVLWPSEVTYFDATLRARKSDIAGVMLQTWASDLRAMAPTPENASVILSELATREKYFSLLDTDQVAAVRAVADAKLDEILEPLVARELGALESLPHTLEGATASVAWYRQFRQKFSRFAGAGTVRLAEREFNSIRRAIFDAAIGEFSANIDALPMNSEGGQRASILLDEAFPLRSDKSLPAFEHYQDVVVNKLSLIENSKFDAQVFSLLELSRQSSGLRLDGYLLPGLIAAIYNGQIRLIPDDAERTRPQVAGLIRVMNQECGEAPMNVAVASLTYISPKMDDVMLEALEGFADALQNSNFTALTRQSRVAPEGIKDGQLFFNRNDDCGLSQVRRFRSNLNDLILARYRQVPHPYNQRLFTALLSEADRARFGLPNPMSAVIVADTAASKANLVRQYERELRQKSRSPRQQSEIENIKRNCNNILMNLRGVCDAAAKCGEYFVYFHPEHRKGGRRYEDVFTVSTTPPDADVHTIKELWSYAEQSKMMSRGQEFSRGETILRSQLKPVLYVQKLGDYYGSRANLCKPYRPGELSCDPTQPYCTER